MDSFRESVFSDKDLRMRVLSSWKDKWCPTASDSDCWTSTGQPTKANGYVQGSAFGHNKFALIHVVAAHSSPHVEQFPEQPNSHASHMCGNAVCFNPRHLVWESSLANQSRKGCPGIIVDLEGTRFLACRHEPTCKKELLLKDCPVI